MELCFIISGQYSDGSAYNTIYGNAFVFPEGSFGSAIPSQKHILVTFNVVTRNGKMFSTSQAAVIIWESNKSLRGETMKPVIVDAVNGMYEQLTGNLFAHLLDIVIDRYQGMS
jgi:hypothetical protein